VVTAGAQVRLNQIATEGNLSAAVERPVDQ
jgi:hypothetical protein